MRQVGVALEGAKPVPAQFWQRADHQDQDRGPGVVPPLDPGRGRLVLRATAPWLRPPLPPTP